MTVYEELLDELAARQAERREADRVFSRIFAKGREAARTLRMLKAMPTKGDEGPGLVAATRAERERDKKRPDLVKVLGQQIDAAMADGRYHEARVLEARRNRVRT